MTIRIQAEQLAMGALNQLPWKARRELMESEDDQVVDTDPPYTELWEVLCEKEMAVEADWLNVGGIFELTPWGRFVKSVAQ